MQSYQTDTRLSRHKQINTLRVFNENVEEVTEDVEYRVKLTSSDVQLALVITLPQEFPQEKPIIRVDPPISHPWVESPSGVVNSAPGLISFSPHSDLGRVVQAIRRDIEKSTITVIPSAGAVPTWNMNPPQGNTTASSDPITAKLTKLSKEELFKILNDEEAFENFIVEVETNSLEAMDENISSMEEDIKAMAEANIDLQKQVETERNSLLCKMEDFHGRKAALEMLVDKVKTKKTEVTPGALADKLLRLSVKHEEESEKIADQFLDQDLTIEDFISSYTKSRELCHKNKLKAEKVKALEE